MDPKQRQTRRSGSSNSDHTLLLRSDLLETTESELQQQNHGAQQQLLDQIGMLLNQADEAVTQMDADQQLGGTILRASQMAADAVGQLAQQIEQQTDEQRHAVAQACLQDAAAAAQQQNDDDDEEEDEHDMALNLLQKRPRHGDEQSLTQLSSTEVAQALTAAAELLRDVEATLRAISQDEASELADVALTVAHLFLASLQSMHHSIVVAAPSPENAKSRSACYIEEISDEENEGPKTPQTKSSSPHHKHRHSTHDRLRVLWPPLGPCVSQALQQGSHAATQQPLLAVALGLTLWPVAVCTAFLATPVVVMDSLVLQPAYNSFDSNTTTAPVVHGMERAAAQFYQTARLSAVCTKLLARQSWRLVQRQVARHGGIEGVAQLAAGWTVDRVTHPVESIGMAWNAAAWSAGAVVGVWQEHVAGGGGSHADGDDEHRYSSSAVDHSLALELEQ